jgi:hypothetical protein
VRLRHERRATQIERVAVGFVVVLWAIGPSCLFGGGLALPPVIPVFLTLVRATSGRLRTTRTRTADRSVDCSAGRRRLARSVFASSAWCPQKCGTLSHASR